MPINITLDTLAKLYFVWKTTMSNSNPKTFLQGRRKKQKHSSLTPMFNCDISYLDEITNNVECSTIKVKIIHILKTTSTLWVSSSKGENINMLLMDEKVMFNYLIFKFCLYALYSFDLTILSFLLFRYIS